MPEQMRKVTAFVVTDNSSHVLIFRHPMGGFQLPAGTVELGEGFIEAAAREVAEETGVRVDTNTGVLLGVEPHELPSDERIMLEPWEGDAHMIARGQRVFVMEQLDDDEVCVEARIYDLNAHPMRVIDSVQARVPTHALSHIIERGFVLFTHHPEHDPATTEPWPQAADGHIFEVFWTSPHEVHLTSPQQRWWETYMNDMV